ncbi:ferredoxin [Mycobacteroides abscessus subsp. abscessus]|uniref:PDR/VanB family oxidoreductase n=1 Tax=Mycobacteroides abscessus TaxID=36809 RepID=UPI0009280F90|nr:PDR/VanB family oxidoreductase [Mycobacteroides abscessus]SIK10530.1 ferredoxin [Mycobacteroides abscessus subsp. abscessus]
MNAPATSALEAFVYSISWAGTDMLCYDLRLPEGTDLPRFEAGAHIDVHIAPGLIRQYSLCNDPDERHRYVVCVQRDAAGRGGSRALHNTLRTGQKVQISLPRNHFPLRPADRYILVAGGIGVTPLVAMAESLRRAGSDYELHVYARSRDRIPLAERLTAGPLAQRTTAHLSTEGDNLRSAPPAALANGTDSTLVYTCGPEGFMQAVRDHALAGGFGAEQVHQERFAPAAAPDRDPSTYSTFEVVIASSGQRITVSPQDTIADALTAHGIEVELSCEQGMCGACLTPVVSGIPDHRDDVQTPAEQESNGQITVCCSRAKTGELVLGL